MEFPKQWRLNECPFEPTWDARFYLQSRAQKEVLQRLRPVSDQTRLLGMLTDGIGCGKTLTRATVDNRLDRRQFLVLTHENSAFEFNDLLGSSLRKSKAARKSWITATARVGTSLNGWGNNATRGSPYLVLLSDEAQEMSPAALNELKQSKNLNRRGRNPLTVLLGGSQNCKKSWRSCQPAFNEPASGFTRPHFCRRIQGKLGQYFRQRLAPDLGPPMKIQPREMLPP